MKWLGFCVTAVVVLAVAVAVRYHQFKTIPAQNPPPLEIVAKEIDLGMILILEDCEFETIVRNNSDEPLQIDQIQSSCGCVNTRLGKNPLEPGESTELRGTLRGKGRVGPFRHQVMLKTDGPRSVRAICSIRGEAERRIRLVSDRLTLRPDFLSERPDSQRLLVQNTSRQVVDVVCPDGLPAGVRLELDGQAIGPGKSRPLTVTVAPNLAVRRDLNLMFGCNHPLEKTLPMTVEVRPAAEVKVSPQVVRFGALSRRELLAMGPVRVDLEGDPLAASELVEVTLPRYLRESGNNSKGEANRRFIFAFQDTFGKADLSSAIVLKFRHSESGRVFQVKVKVSGFLRDHREP